MEADTGFDANVIRADGGLTANHFVCQFIADMIDKPLEIPENTETTAWGAACLAGLQAGIFQDFEDIKKRWRCHREYTPQLDTESQEILYEGWQKAVARCVL